MGGVLFGFFLLIALLLTIWMHRRNQRLAEQIKRMPMDEESYIKALNSKVEVMKANNLRLEALILKLNNHEKDDEDSEEKEGSA